MPYLPNHTYDVFVSYAHGPEPFTGFHGMRTDFLSKWTHSFIDDLSSQLDVILGTKDQNRRVSIWMDPALSGNHALSDGLNGQINQSALLLVVMSQFYLESKWCVDELTWFSGHHDLDNSNRIFVVKAFNTLTERWPAALKEQFAVVCSNARAGELKYEEFQDIVVAALAETERSSIIADREDGSGQIRLITLEDEISRADTVVIICFDQDWNWANKMILQLREAMGEQGAETKIFVMGPEYKNKGKFVTAFKFRTVVGVLPDNRIPSNQIADDIKRILKGPA
jgi:hypothetical protein